MKAYVYEALDDSNIRTYLDSDSTEKNDCVYMESLDALIKKGEKADISESSACLRMKNLFISYKALLRRHGLSCFSENNFKMAVKQVLSDIKPDTLRVRLE